jgi:hypothetical protein
MCTVVHVSFIVDVADRTRFNICIIFTQHLHLAHSFQFVQFTCFSFCDVILASRESRFTLVCTGITAVSNTTVNSQQMKGK